VKLRVRVDHATYSALKEVEEEYREVLEDAINYGLVNKTTSFTRIKAGIYRTEREKHKDLPSHYIYTGENVIAQYSNMKKFIYSKCKKIVMEQIVDFPDPAYYQYPDELRLPDGTLLMGKTVGESPIIMNRKKWRLYITYIRLDNDPDNERPILRSTQNGVVYRLPPDSITHEILGYIKNNPGVTPEQVMGHVLAWLQSEGIDLSDEDRMFLFASYIYDTISLLAIYGLIRIEK